MIIRKLVLYPIKKYDNMLMNIAEIKKANEPTYDLPFVSGEPYRIPIIDAQQSEIINISQEVMAKPLEKNMQLTRNPSPI